MPIVKAQCTNCNGMLQVDSSKDAAICPYCNTPYIVEKAINYYTTNNNNVINNNYITNNYGGSSAQSSEMEYNCKMGMAAAERGEWDVAYRYLDLLPEWYRSQRADVYDYYYRAYMHAYYLRERKYTYNFDANLYYDEKYKSTLITWENSNSYYFKSTLKEYIEGGIKKADDVKKTIPQTSEYQNYIRQLDTFISGLKEKLKEYDNLPDAETYERQCAEERLRLDRQYKRKEVVRQILIPVIILIIVGFICTIGAGEDAICFDGWMLMIVVPFAIWCYGSNKLWW